MYTLEKLVPIVKKRKRVGRGGKLGGTSGKGHKGQKARSGGSVRPGFEGGQMPLYRRLPKRGFKNVRFQDVIQTINLGRLNEIFKDGSHVTRESLLEAGALKSIKSKKFLVKILGDGQLEKKLTVEVDLISKSAHEAIVKAGGEVRLTIEG